MFATRRAVSDRVVRLCKVPGCNTPETPRSLRDWPLCEKHQTSKEAVDRRWGHKPSSRAYIPPAPPEIGGGK